MAAAIPYEGEQPYVFISYAHANAPAVMQVVEELLERGFRVWYDAGIEVGSEWPEYIAQHLARADVMIAFLSNAYVRSDNCRREMHYALTKRIQTVNIFLEETRMTPGMELQIGSLFALMKYTMSDAAFYEKLFAAPQLDAARLSEGMGQETKQRGKKRAKKVPVDLTVEERKKKRKRTRRIAALSVMGLLLTACVVLGIVGYSTGLLQRVRISHRRPEISALPADAAVQMQNAALERAARIYCGIPDKELTVSELIGVTSLHISGAGVSFNGAEEIPAEWAANAWQDLSDLQYFPNLIRLSLSGLRLTSLATLPPCGIEYLKIENCPLAGLDGIGALTSLREIETTDTPLRELGNIEQCLQLRRMSLIGSNISGFSAARPLTRLAEIELSNCGINDLRPLLGLSSLTDVSLYDCDLRGSFFKAFDRERAIISLTLVDCELNSTKNLEDFTGLTTLTLIRTGARLDWSVLAELPALKTVAVDESLEAVLKHVSDGVDAAVLKTDTQHG